MLITWSPLLSYLDTRQGLYLLEGADCLVQSSEAVRVEKVVCVVFTIYSPPEVDRIWLWVYDNKMPIYPIFYLLKGDYRSGSYWQFRV